MDECCQTIFELWLLESYKVRIRRVQIGTASVQYGLSLFRNLIKSSARVKKCIKGACWWRTQRREFTLKEQRLSYTKLKLS
jgi:hypothetical protein